MRRYIDADAVLAEIQEELDFNTPMYSEEQNNHINIGLRIARRCIKKQPTADVVEVVRCKDCKHLKHSQSVLNGELECGYCRLYANYLPSGLTYRGGNDYCSYGERREE